MASRWRTLARDPLLHFAALGTLLFVVLPRDEDTSSHRIQVSRADLIGFLQVKARLFDGRSFAQIYDSLSPAERKQLAADYVRQEALYRQALADGLDKADPLIRSRLVQQMELLLREDVEADAVPSEADVQAYYRQHSADYANPGSATFTHVFFDRRSAGAENAAKAALGKLRAGKVAAEDALPFGDRFPYQRNYADVTAAIVQPELGADVARAVFAAPVGQWAGPYPSPLGWHLVLVSRRQGASTPALADIYPAVARDAQEARRTATGERAVQRVLADYTVDYAPDVGAMK